MKCSEALKAATEKGSQKGEAKKRGVEGEVTCSMTLKVAVAGNHNKHTHTHTRRTLSAKCSGKANGVSISWQRRRQAGRHAGGKGEQQAEKLS